MKDFDAAATLTTFDEREAEIQRILANLEQTHSPRVRRDVRRAFSRELQGIAKRRQLFGQYPSWANEGEDDTPIQQNRQYTITLQPRTLASYFEEAE